MLFDVNSHRIIAVYCSRSLTAKWQNFFIYYLEYLKKKLLGFHEVQTHGKGEIDFFFNWSIFDTQYYISFKGRSESWYYTESIWHPVKGLEGSLSCVVWTVFARLVVNLILSLESRSSPHQILRLARRLGESWLCTLVLRQCFVSSVSARVKNAASCVTGWWKVGCSPTSGSSAHLFSFPYRSC